MRITRRRRLDAVVLGLGALVIGVVATVGGLAGDTERVTGMWVGATIADSGAASIVEIIDYDFGLGAEKHGIFRTIPGLTTDAAVSVRSASAPDGIAAITSEHVGGEPGVRIKIGDPATTISGRHRYRIGYTLPALAPGGHLAWDAVGAEWTVPVQQTEVHVVAPWTFEGLTCSRGTTGSTGGCALSQPQPGHLVVTIGALDSGEGITVQAGRGTSLAVAPRLPAPPISAPPDPGAGLVKPALVAAFATLVATAVASRRVRRAGRERVGAGGEADAAWAGGGGPSGEVRVDHAELATMATTEFAPPEGVTAAQGGIVLTEEVRAEHKVAWLLEAAIADAVELIDGDGKAVTLVRKGSGPPDTAPILDLAFAGRPEVELGSYDASFAAAWGQVGASLRAWERTSGLWDPAGDRRRVRVRVLGAVAGVVGAVGVGITAALASRWGTHWLLAVGAAALLAGGGFAAAVRGWELRVRTPAGSGLWLRIESFRRFLAASEAFHAEEAAKRGVLREYTAWAVAVGEIDRWAHAVSASTTIRQDAGLGYVYLAPLLLASTASASTAPSSSGGGGGGGSVGGGGGGGGGGSW